MREEHAWLQNPDVLTQPYGQMFQTSTLGR